MPSTASGETPARAAPSSGQPVIDNSVRELRDVVATLHALLDRTSLPPPGQSAGAAALLDALPAAVLLLDHRGRISQCNAAAAELLGADVCGQLWAAVLRQRLVAGEDPTELLLGDGRRLGVATRAMPGAGGQVVMLSDVSEERALQQLLGRRSRLAEMGEMLARLAHQLGTPLATAALYARELSKAGSGSARDRELAARLEQSLARMRSQVRDMQVFTSNAVVAAAPVRVGDLLSALREQVEPHFTAAGARLDIDSRADDYWLRANAAALGSVFLNLAENALQMSSRSLQLRVTARAVGAAVQFVFHDNGPGIAPEVLANVFEPFFTTRSDGTGLGLAVAKSVVEAHGGRISLGQAPYGCRIEVQLPAAGAPAARSAA